MSVKLSFYLEALGKTKSASKLILTGDKKVAMRAFVTKGLWTNGCHVGQFKSAQKPPASAWKLHQNFFTPALTGQFGGYKFSCSF